MTAAGRALARDAALVLVLRLGAALLVDRAGVRYLSDDDFARTTIAQLFAVAPRLDPSGTSWLPFPFWSTGAFMVLAGRSHEVARAVHVALGATGAALLTVALGRANVRGWVRVLVPVAILFAPAAAWAGATATPEAFVGPFVAAGLVGGLVGRGRLAERLAFAGLAALGTLSRYDAWGPSLFAAAVALTGQPRRDTGRAPLRARLAVAAVYAAGPTAWIAWNQLAHGDAWRFFRRVAAYRRAAGHGTTGPLDALLLYPRELLASAPLALVVGSVAVALALRARGRRTLTSGGRAALVLAGAALAGLLQLALGALGDGAPTHHPGRALLPVACLLGAAGALASDVLDGRAPLRRAVGVGLGAAIAFELFSSVRPPPQAPGDDRSAQLARGRALRDAPGLVVTPCAYEHYALVAAYGAPERVRTVDPTARSTPNAECPRVEVAAPASPVTPR